MIVHKNEQLQNRTNAALQPSFTSVQTGKLNLQHHSTNQAKPGAVIPIEADVLQSPEQPFNSAWHIFMESRFGHDFSRMRVHHIMPEMIQTKLAMNQPEDKYEQEADRVAEQVTQLHEPLSDKTTLQAMRSSSEENIQKLQRKTIAANITALNPANSKGGATQVSNTLNSHITAHLSSGHPLPRPTQQFMETRFGTDFSHVRLHTSNKVQQMTRDLHAQAFTVGPNIFLDSRHYQPNSAYGRRLLAHELTHVIQQGRQFGGNLSIMRNPDDLTNKARYPTETERGRILDILNPQQQAAAAAGGTVPAVTDPQGFRDAMKHRLDPYIDRVLPGAHARQSSTVTLGEPTISSLGDIAQPEVRNFYGSYLGSAVHSPPEQQRRASYRLGEHLHLVPTTQSAQTDVAACEWVASRMRNEGSQILKDYNVLSGEHARDEALFEQVRDFIFAQRRSDIRTIVLFHPGYHGGGEAYIQSHIAPISTDLDRQDTLRRGRWNALGTIIHEMLHEAAHERFMEVARRLEESGIAVEGFAEYFTRPVYNKFVNRAQNDSKLRLSIEGVEAPFDSSLAPERVDYQGYVNSVINILNILGENEESLKVAYFLGLIEYIGLGGWNASEAARHRALREPANNLGVAIMLTDNGGGLFRLDYSRVIVGRGGNFQFRLGGGINYLTTNQRLGLSGNASLQYSWPNVYVRGGVGIGGSASANQPFSNSVRLDLIPGVEAGVRIGVARIGAGINLLIPVAGGPIDDRALRVGAGLGFSLDL